MKKILFVVLLVCGLGCAAQPSHPSPISIQKIGSVLSCHRTKLTSYPDVPPRATEHDYVVRFYYGVLTPGAEEPDELQLIVYAPKEESAILYQVYLDKNDGQESIYVGQWGTLEYKNGHMTPDDIPGGTASYDEWVKLLAKISKQPVISVPEEDVKPGAETCIYQQ